MTTPIRPPRWNDVDGRQTVISWQMQADTFMDWQQAENARLGMENAEYQCTIETQRDRLAALEADCEKYEARVKSDHDEIVEATSRIASLEADRESFAREVAELILDGVLQKKYGESKTKNAIAAVRARREAQRSKEGKG